MKLYADVPARFTAQLVGDVLFVCWVLAWVWIGNVVHDGTMDLAGPGHQIIASATGLSDSMRGAGDALGDLPVIGDGASAPFDQASEASASLADAGRTEVRAVERLAFWLGLSIALIPILVVGVLYLPRRARFVRDTVAAQRFLDGPADLEVFALRAIVSQPLHVLARVSDDPMTALRERDRTVIARLADLELRANGLTAPARTT
jgi:hypothetical protein